MKSAEVFNPDAKKPNQSGGKGGNTTLSSSRRRPTHGRNGETCIRAAAPVCEPLLRPKRAVNKGANECLLDTSFLREKTGSAQNGPLWHIHIGHCLKCRDLGRSERSIIGLVGLLFCSVWLASQILLQSRLWSIDAAIGGWVWHMDLISKWN